MSKLIIVIEGGLVQSIFSTEKNMNVVILDKDDQSEDYISIDDTQVPIHFKEGTASDVWQEHEKPDGSDLVLDEAHEIVISYFEHLNF